MHVRRTVTATLTTAAYAVMAAVLAVLTALSLLITAVFTPAEGTTEPTVLAEQMDFSFGVTPSFVLGLPLFVIAIAGIGMLLSRFDERCRLGVLLTYVLVVQILWIGALAATDPRYPDSVMLSRGASELVRGNIGAYDPNYCAAEGALGYQPACLGQEQPLKGNLFNYFSWYPFQSGAMLWFALVYKIFGVQNFMAFQFVNALAVTAIVAVLYRLCGLMGLGQRALSMFCLLVAACFPLLMFSAFTYTNAVGLLFALLAGLLLVDSLRAVRLRDQILLFTGSCACGAVGVMIKNTFSICILAMLIVAILRSVRLRRWWTLAAAVVCYPIMMRSADLPVTLLEHLTGQSFGPGMPTLSWIAMGLQHKPGVLPGWWQSGALDAYLSSGGDPSLQREAAVRSIGTALSSFAADPLSALGFIDEKLATEWAEPTFETVLYSGLIIPAHAGNGISRLLLAEPGRSAVNAYGDVMQTAVYLLALVAVIGMIASAVKHRRRDDDTDDTCDTAALLLAVCFLGGFCCYLLWEAKSVYTLPFYLMLLPFAARGLDGIATAAASSLSARMSSHRTDIKEAPAKEQA